MLSIMPICLNREAFSNEQRVVDVKEAMKWILGPFLTQAANLHFKLDVCYALLNALHAVCVKDCVCECENRHLSGMLLISPILLLMKRPPSSCRTSPCKSHVERGLVTRGWWLQQQ